MIDAVDLPQASRDLELGHRAEGNQTLHRGDEQLPQHIRHLAVRFRQLDRDIIIFVTLAKGGDLDPVKGHLEGKPDDLSGQPQQGGPLPVHPDLHCRSAGHVVVPDILHKGDLLQNILHPMGNAS